MLSVLLATTACGDEPDDTDASPAPESPATSTPTETPSPFQVIQGRLARCGPQPVAAAETGFGYELLNEMDGSVTPIGERVLRRLAAG